MKEVKICKRAYIEQDTDRWGHLLGTYSVNYGAGFVSENMWEDIYLYENYGNTKETKLEQETALNFIAAGGMPEKAYMPIMKRVIKRAGGLLWQFNIKLDEPPKKDGDEDVYLYARTFASYMNPSLFLHDKSMDEEYEKLKLKADEMNREANAKT